MVTEAIDLVAEARRGDSNAFGELVKPLYQPAERLAVSMVSSREVARDLVQEVRISEQSGHPFRTKVATDFGAK